jgi:hypothetical protein
MRAVVVVIIVVVDDEGWNATFKILTLNVEFSLHHHSSPITEPSPPLLKEVGSRCHSHSVSVTEKT